MITVVHAEAHPKGQATAATGEWRKQASCVGYDPEYWFPIGRSGPVLAEEALAKSICYTCPVKTACLEWALATGQDAGIWGGLNSDERRATRQARNTLNS